MKDVAFKVFSGPANDPKGRVAALRIPGGASLRRGEIDGYTEFVKIYGAKGLAYIKVNDVTQLNESGLQSPIVKNLSEASLAAVIERTGAANGDLIFFGADTRQGGERCARRAAPQDRPREGPCRRPRLGAAVGGRFPDVRIQRGREPLGRAAPSLHRAEGRPRRLARHRSRPLPVQGLRHGAERLGSRRRLGAYPPAGRAGEGVRRT